jgi:hypothetical protein
MGDIRYLLSESSIIFETQSSQYLRDDVEIINR